VSDTAQAVLSSPNITPLIAIHSRPGLGIIAELQGDAEAAREQYAALEPWRGTFANRTTATGRLSGLLSETKGDRNQAVAHFEYSLNFCRRAGARPELAWTCCDYADTLLQRNEPGDREKAMSLSDESLAISSELGMRPLMERVLSRREILEA